MSPRVAVVSFDDVPSIGGQGRYVGALEREMPREGFQVAMVTPRRGPWGESARIPRLTRRPPLDYSLFLRGHLAQAGASLQPDLWHAQGGPGGVLLPRHPPGAPLVYTAHHTYRIAHGRSLATIPLARLEAKGYREAEHVVALSPSTAASVAANGQIPSERISVIPAGVDTAWLSPPEPGRERRGLLFVGRLVPLKGVQYFVAMFRALSEQHPQLVAEVCGEGILYRVAEAAAEQMGGRLRLLGRVSDQELLEAYRRASVFVMPSKYEGLGLVALEAMSCGTPVVGLDVPGLRDLRDTGITLVKPDDQLGLRKAVDQLLRDRPRWEEASARGLEAIRSKYAWDAVRPRLAEVYRSVLPSNSTQAA